MTLECQECVKDRLVFKELGHRTLGAAARGTKGQIGGLGPRTLPEAGGDVSAFTCVRQTATASKPLLAILNKTGENLPLTAHRDKGLDDCQL